jgi:hypothetical protein
MEQEPTLAALELADYEYLLQIEKLETSEFGNPTIARDLIVP